MGGEREGKRLKMALQGRRKTVRTEGGGNLGRDP